MAYPILAASSTWYKSSQARSTITQINIVDSYTPTGSENETWNADTGNSGSIKCYRTGTALTIAGNGSGKISLNANSSYAFSDSTRKVFFLALTSINGLDLLDTSSVTNMSGMFYGAAKVSILRIGEWVTSNVTNMTGMFASPSSVGNMALNTLDVGTKIVNEGTANEYVAWDTKNVTAMQAMFQGCANLVSINLGNWNMSKVATTKQMFLRCTGLEELDVATKTVSLGSYGTYVAWDVSKVTNFAGMFCGNNYAGDMSLRLLDVAEWDTSSATDMSDMFYGCGQFTTIPVENFNVSKVTTFDHMFADCLKLESINLTKWRTPALTNMDGMFNTCKNLITIDVGNFDTSKVTMFSQIFDNCSSLVKIIGLEKWNTSSGTHFNEMFLGCKLLTALDVSSFTTENAIAVSNMFQDCEKISYLDLSGFNTLNCTYMGRMFENMHSLQKVTLGENFTFYEVGATSASISLPTPDSAYITDADGRWYSSKGVIYSSPSDIPSLTAETYYAVAADIYAIVKGAVLSEIAEAIREANGTNTRYKLSEIPKAILALVGKT